MKPLLSFVMLLASMLAGVHVAIAHESRPLNIEISELSSGRYALRWNVPSSVQIQNRPVVKLPVSCIQEGKGGANARLYKCENDLSGQKISIAYPQFNPAVSSIIRLRRHTGEERIAVLAPDELVWIVPEKETTTSVARNYFFLGVEHILGGIDHLLFVACLVLIAGTWKRVLITVTGFTIAHSITLALAALGVVHVPVPPVEAVIALSILFLASEIARQRRDTLTWRYPLSVSASFGLLHGFGFASALAEIGLPQVQLMTGLFFFNLGVEAGQLAFVALLFGAIAVLRISGVVKMPIAAKSDVLPDWVERPAAYIVGSLATVWLIERISNFWV